MKLANKTQSAATYSLTVSGVDGALLGLPEQAPGLSAVAHLSVPASEVGTIRLMIQAPPAAVPDGRRNAVLTLRNDATGEQIQDRALFLSPALAGE